MAKITAHRSVATNIDGSIALRQISDTLIRRKHGRIEVATANYLEGRVGSQVALRLKGGLIANTDDFPLVAAVEVHSVGALTELRITVSDDLGFGLKTGVKNKYTRAVNELADALAASVGQAAGVMIAPPPEFQGSVADELAKLAELHRQGVLSDDEFAAEKAKLLR